MEIIEVNLNDLLKHKSQPRFDDKEGIEELKNSIAEFGVISPPIISPHPSKANKYYIVAGHRRVRAMRELGYVATKAILSDRDSKDIIAPLAENMVKKDLTFIEMALAIHKIKKTHDDLSQKEIAKMLGKTENFISTACRTGALDQEIIEKLYEYREYKFANNLKVCNRLAGLREIRTKMIVLKMIEKLKDKEERDGFSQSIFYQMVVKEIELAKQRARRGELEEIDELSDDTTTDRELTDLNDDAQEQEDFDPFAEEEDEVDLPNMEETDKDMDISSIRTTKGDGFSFKHNQDWSNIELFVDINNISFNSSRELQYILKKIEEKIR